MPPDSQPPKSAFAKKSLGYVSTISRKIILSLGGKSVFMLLIVVALAISAWLLYTFAWAPLTESGLLPAGVGRDNPALSNTLLESINNKRVERSQYQPPSFTAFGPLFQPSATPTPTPLPGR